MIKDMENFVLHELTDEEIESISEDERYELLTYYTHHPLPELSTVKGLLKKFDLKYDDLTEFELSIGVGRCNHAIRTEDQIYISRKNSPLKNNIFINIKPDSEVPDVTIQIQIHDEFIHEEAYTKEGLKLYQT